MGEFWSEVGVASIKFVFYALVAFGGIVVGMKLRLRKNNKA
jgi:hypothetical protein